MAGEYWKAIELEIKKYEEDERLKALEEKLRSEKALREKQRLEKEAFHEKSRLEEEVRQRKEVEEKEIKEILSQTRSILLPIFREAQTNVTKIKNAPKSRIIEESDYSRLQKRYVAGSLFADSIRLQYGDKFEFTPKEKVFIDRFLGKMAFFMQNQIIKITFGRGWPPEEIVEYNFSEVGIYYNDEHLYATKARHKDYSRENLKFIKIGSTVEFIQNPKIIIPNLVDQFKSPATYSSAYSKGWGYLRWKEESYPSSGSSGGGGSTDCCCS